MKIEFTINDNEEFPEMEITRVLATIVDEVNSGWADGVIVDKNGNKIGEWALKEVR